MSYASGGTAETKHDFIGDATGLNSWRRTYRNLGARHVPCQR